MLGSAETGAPASCGIVEIIVLNTSFFLSGTMNTPTTASPRRCRRVNEVRFHPEAFAIDEMSAGMMEVKLRQPKAGVTQLEGIALRSVELDRVAVIDDSLRALTPVETVDVR